MKYDLFWLFILAVLVIIVSIFNGIAKQYKSYRVSAPADEDDCSAWERAGESGISWR